VNKRLKKKEVFTIQGVFFAMKKIINMREMLDNQKGIIKKISSTGDMGRRIREMGLVPNTQIQIQGRAPLKDPVAIKIKDFILTLRNNEASHILVEVDMPEPVN
jgi:ferrous iron transport protein A